MATIQHIRRLRDPRLARQSRPSQREVVLSDGAKGFAASPSGASTGSREALELRDGDPKRYCGQGRHQGRRQRQRRDSPGARRTRRRRSGGARPAYDRARRHADQVAPGRQRDPRGFARGCQGSRRGVQTPSCTRTSAAAARRCLPVPMMNIINGGAHADNNVDMQEFMIVPAGCADASPRRCAGAWRCSMRSRACSRAAACRPPWATRAASRPTCRRTKPRSTSSCRRSNRRDIGRARDIWLGLDAASSEFHQRRPLRTRIREASRLDSQEFVDYLARWVDRYPIVTIEDGMAEGDWDGWRAADGEAGRSRAAGRRRPVRHQHVDPRRGHREAASRTRS